MIRLAPGAERQLAALARHYIKLGRSEARDALVAAIGQAVTRIELDPAVGLPAPRPYPSLARPNRLWVKAGRYWVAYSTASPPMILAVFHDTADIPGRQAP